MVSATLLKSLACKLGSDAQGAKLGLRLQHARSVFAWCETVRLTTRRRAGKSRVEYTQRELLFIHQWTRGAFVT